MIAKYILPVFLLAQVAGADDFTKLYTLIKPECGIGAAEEIPPLTPLLPQQPH